MTKHSSSCPMLPTKLRMGGFGKAILGLAALMLLLYSLVIYQEASKDDISIFKKWLLLNTVAGLWNEDEYLHTHTHTCINYV